MTNFIAFANATILPVRDIPAHRYHGERIPSHYHYIGSSTLNSKNGKRTHLDVYLFTSGRKGTKCINVRYSDRDVGASRTYPVHTLEREGVSNQAFVKASIRLMHQRANELKRLFESSKRV